MMGCFCKKVRTLHCKVVLLDEQELVHEIQENSPGHEVLDTVFRHLNLLETAYFGLRYLDTANQPHWLDPTKKVARELKGTISCTLYFGVKFYAADPCKLLEEITRYQFYLQVKQDILQGRLPVSFDLAAELGAYVVQSELGDYDPRRHSPGYVSEFRFVANQTAELEGRIAELHKGLVGQLPADAEMSYLDRVKWLDMYGVDLHPVLGEDNVEYFLGLTPSGIIVLRNKNKVGNYYWPRINKIYFKGRYFMLRVCDKNNEESTYGFETPSRAACKQLWKCCVEHHAFFRLVRVSPAPNDIFRLSSRFRYSGRTEKQARSDVEAGRRVPPAFERSPSRRQQRRVVEGAAHTPNMEEIENRENGNTNEKNVSTVTPVSTTVIANARRPAPGPSPPLSTRSAPWAEPHARGLYNTSLRSVRSAASTGRLSSAAQAQGSGSGSRQHRRSSSVESHSSTDSRPCRRHRRHRSRKGSDSESEVSKCSERCHSRCRHRHHRHKSRHKGSRVELVDSTGQWREVQRRQAEGGGAKVQQATVVSSNAHPRRSGYANSGADTETADTQHGKNKRRLRTKHRSRSRSPSETKRLPDELKRHLDFDLIDTEGMSEAQLREIPYTVVQTNAKPVKVKMSPSNRRRSHHSSKRSSRSHDDAGSTDRLSVNSQPVSRSGFSIPPLPFSPSASSLLGGGGGGGGGMGSASGSVAGSTHSLTANQSSGSAHFASKTAFLRSNANAALERSQNSSSSSGVVHVPPLPRVPSAIQIGGNNGNNNGSSLSQNSQQMQQNQSNYMKSYQQHNGQRAPAQSKQSSSDVLTTFSTQHKRNDNLDVNHIHFGTDAVTSFMTNGVGPNRSRGNHTSQTSSPHDSGSQSPYGNRTRDWDEGKSAGSRASSGRGSSASASSCTGLPPALPQLPTPNGYSCHQRQAQSPSSSGDGRIVGRRGPLYYQQQQLQRQQQQQLQRQQQQQRSLWQSNGGLGGNTSVKAVKMSPHVQNAAYGSLNRSESALNGNNPPHGTISECTNEETIMNGRTSYNIGRKDTTSETRTEL